MKLGLIVEVDAKSCSENCAGWELPAPSHPTHVPGVPRTCSGMDLGIAVQAVVVRATVRTCFKQLHVLTTKHITDIPGVLAVLVDTRTRGGGGLCVEL